MTTPRRSLGKFCQAGSTGSIVESLGNMVAVRLRTDASVTGRGFHLRYSTLCDTTITGLAGVIESPNFPEDYPYNRWGGSGDTSPGTALGPSRLPWAMLSTSPSPTSRWSRFGLIIIQTLKLSM